jgi:hypothetical protein
MYIEGTGCKSTAWIYLAYDRDPWQASVNAVIVL